MTPNDSNQAIRAIEQVVYPITAGKAYKSMLFTPEAMLLCSKSFDNATDFQVAFDEAKDKTMTLTSTITAPYEKILRFRNWTGSDVIHVKFDSFKFSWPSQIDLSNGETDVHNIFTYLEKIQGYRRSEVQLTPFRAILPNIGYLALAVGGTLLFYNLATGNMGTGSGVGRTRAKAEIFKAIADMLGPTGSILLGLAAIILALWFLWKKFNNPPVEIRLER